jgi:putative DNA primase/helicase
MTAPLLDAALEMHAAGLAVLPAAPGKRPAVPWREFQHQRPNEAQLRNWFQGNDYAGLGIVCGSVSGGLEVSEIEGRAVDAGALTEITELATNSGLGELWQKVILNGWSTRSPSGGVHLIYRLTGGVEGNVKLAAQADNVTLAETRGQGGFIVAAPSGGPVHPNGGTWQTLAGGPSTIPTLSPDEREALHVLLRQLDQRPVAPPASASPFVAHSGVRGSEGGISPGDDYNARTTWPEVLEPAGWRQLATRGGVTQWRRPGKTEGISATTGYGGGDWLWCFTSSTEFEPDRTFTRFGAYAVLHHGGDHSATARALRAKGYGTPAPEPTRRVVTSIGSRAPTSGAGAPMTEGALATVHQLPAPTEGHTLDRSEDGHAQALIAEHGDVIRFCVERRRWLAWNGQVWVEESGEDGAQVREYAKAIARRLPDNDAAALAWKRKALSAAGTTGALRQARTDARVTVSVTELDANGWELNTPGGVVDLRTGQLSPPDPSKLHTRMTACTPDWAADRSRWLQFLDETFPGNQDLIDYLQRLVGYSAVGVVGPHVLPFALGSGGNGKGVFLESISKVLGRYATSSPAGFLMAQSSQKHETELAMLAGQRMVVCSEVNEGDRFDEAKVKGLTGGDTITARFMRQDHFTFTPSHTLWLMGNHQPRVSGGGHSFWRRLRQIDFGHEVPEERRVDDLQTILAREHGPALLSWIIDGAVDYARGGLREPASVRVATADYAHDQDTVARFLEERCQLGGGQHVQLPATVVRTAYERWCAEAGEQPMSAKAFGLALRHRGVEPVRNRVSRGYTGITLLADEDGDASPAPTFHQPAAPQIGYIK